MTEHELVAAYRDGQISRRTFIRRLLGVGVSLAAAVTYADVLSAPPARAASADLYDLYSAEDHTAGAGVAGAGAASGTAAATALPAIELTVHPREGPPGRPFTVAWSRDRAPAGYVFDVQIKRPGQGWDRWRWNQVRRRVVDFSPRQVGTYRFRARLRPAGTGEAGGWSRAGALKITLDGPTARV